MFPCERVGPDFFGSTPQLFSNSVHLAVTPEELFEVLADADAWPRWATVITKVTWTSPEPRGVGATRLVAMRGGIVGSEEFLTWDPGRHMAFRFNESSTSALAAFAEDYRIEPAPHGCRLTWSLATRMSGPARLAAPLTGPAMNLAFRRFLGNLRRYTGKRFATTRRT